MDIAIVDDEIQALQAVSDRVIAYAKQRALPCHIFTCTSAEALRKANRTFDLIFLDIQLQSLSGIELAKKLRAEGNNSYLVFVTALPEYVYDAFEVTASDYLLKPIEEGRFLRMMDRICSSLQEREKSSLLIPSRGNACKAVSLRDILYCEAVNHKTLVRTKTEVHSTSFKMEELCARLDDRFFKCHRSYLVNLDAVCGYTDGLALLESGEKIPVSRLRGQEFSMKILQHMKKGY